MAALNVFLALGMMTILTILRARHLTLYVDRNLEYVLTVTNITT
jgi:hypothetical protein